MINYYICNYIDYPDLPEKLFKKNSAGSERRSLDGSKFVVWCEKDSPRSGFLSWMLGSETALTHEEVLDITTSTEWNDEE